MGSEQVPLKEVVFCDTLNVTFLIYFPVFHCLFYTILRFPGQSFTVVRTHKIETTTFKTPHTNSFEKWYPHKKQRKSVLYFMGKQAGSFERMGFLRYFYC